MNYRDYSSEDFAADAHFQKWVLQPDVDTNLFWENWLLQNPEKRSEVEEARKLLATFRFQEQEYSDEFIQQLWKKIDGKIDAEENVRQLYSSDKNSFKNYFNLLSKVAAAILILIATDSIFYKI